MKTDLFQSCGYCWIFQICWHVECSTFTASSSRIWNNSTGIPSPPLALFVVMLPKAHLTSHSRMSGSRWVITPLWLSGSWKSFLYRSFVYYCYLFLIASGSVRSTPFLSFIVPIFAWQMMLWKCCTQYASKFGKLSSGHRTGKGQFSLQSQRKAMPKNAQTTAQLHSSHTLVK